MNERDIVELASAIANVRDRLLLASAAFVSGDADKGAEELEAAANVLHETIATLQAGAPS